MTDIQHWQEELKADLLAELDKPLAWARSQEAFTLRQAGERVVGNRVLQHVINGAEYVAQVRACLKSGRWDSFWQGRHPPPL
ncbi:MAG: hypothetical protein ACE5H6_04290 [Dehalococcoidia bacterium]